MRLSPTAQSREDAAILSALDSLAGRVALAQAMIEPIRISLDYQAIGRRLLMVNELPTGALPRHEGDVIVRPHLMIRPTPPRGFVGVVGSSLFAPYSCFNGTVSRFSLSRR